MSQSRRGLLSNPFPRGFAAFTVIVIVFVAAMAAIFYYRERIQSTVFSPHTSPSVVSLQVDTEVPETVKTIMLEPVQRATPARADSGSGGARDTETDGASEALRRGDPEEAVRLLKDSLASNPASKEIKEALAAGLNAAGLAEYEKKSYKEAKSLLEEAVGLSSEGVYARNLAIVKLKLDELDGAAALLEPFADDPGTRIILKGIYVELGNRAFAGGDGPVAAGYYEKGVRLDPDDKELGEALARIEGERSAESGMGVRDGGHFVVKYEGGENAATGHLIGMLLEEAYIKVGADLSFHPEDTITALLYSRERFRDITRSPAWSGGIYDGRIKLPAGGIYGKTEELERVIFHEYTHAVVHRLSGGRAPVWLNEGLAMYEEGKRAGDYGQYIRRLLATGKVDLRPLEGSFMGLDAESAQAAYLLSLSAMQYIIDDFGIFSIRRIFENLGDGMSLEDAISSVLYISYDDLQKSWAANVLRP